MKTTPPEELLIGAHTSAAGGAYHALLEGKSIGATTIQFFTANQKQWAGKPLTESGIALFESTLEETGLEQIMSHAGYLINLGSPNPENLHKSRKAFLEEIERCLALNLTYLNFHPGAALGRPMEECLDRIVESILLFENYFVDDSLRLLLETTAGQGTQVGRTFEEIGYMFHKLKKRVPIGVCIDTCHIFVAGYDIRKEEGWMRTLEAFDRSIGLENLYAFHLNDSVKPLGSRSDRHAPIGEGEIGRDSFRFLMHYHKTREIPKYLETPGGVEMWDKEIWMLREFAREKK